MGKDAALHVCSRSSLREFKGLIRDQLSPDPVRNITSDKPPVSSRKRKGIMRIDASVMELGGRRRDGPAPCPRKRDAGYTWPGVVSVGYFLRVPIWSRIKVHRMLRVVWVMVKLRLLCTRHG